MRGVRLAVSGRLKFAVRRDDGMRSGAASSEPSGGTRKMQEVEELLVRDPPWPTSRISPLPSRASVVLPCTVGEQPTFSHPRQGPTSRAASQLFPAAELSPQKRARRLRSYHVNTLSSSTLEFSVSKLNSDNLIFFPSRRRSLRSPWF